GMALARTLPELFLARFVLGGMGAASTVAYIIVGRTGRGSEVRRRIATLQSGMTVGQVIGPLIGAIAAARFGFRASFVVGGAILLACAAMVHWLVEPPQAAAAPSPDARPVQPREVGIVALIVLGARVVQHAGGGAIGFINSARIAAGFIGPVLATTLLTWTSPAALYLLLAAIGLACVPLVRMREAGARA